jgi:aspartyl protease family protein
VRRRLLWISLLILLIVTVTLVALHGGYDGVAGSSFRFPDVSSAMLDVGIIIFITGMLLTAFRWRLSEALEAAMLWLVVVAFVLVGYTYRTEVREVAERVLAQIMPGYAASRGRMVELARGRGGEFPVTTRVNGARVAMILDTGASAVMLTQEAARAAGLPIEVLTYSVSLETANGRTRAAPVTIDRLAVGNIVERAVPALIVPSSQLKTNLLGMTFLNRLESWQVKGDRLQMRGYP